MAKFKIVQTSPVWPLGALLLVLVFAGWGISLLVSVERRQDEVQDYVTLISRLNFLEESIRDLGKEIFEENANRPADSLMMRWQQQYAGYMQRKKEVLKKSKIIPAEIQPLFSRIDSSAVRMNLLFTRRLLDDPAAFRRSSMDIQFHQEMSRAIDQVKAVTGVLRERLNGLSTELSGKWKSLSFLVFISFLLAIQLSIILYFYQRDLLKRKRTEEILRQLTAEFRAMFKAIPDAVFFTDTNREIVMVNPAFTELFGFNPDEVVGKEPRFLFTAPKDYLSHEKTLFGGEAGEHFPPLEIKYQCKNGDIFIGETVSAAVKQPGEELGFLNIIRDITRRKKAEEQLNEVHNKLEQWVNERTEDLMRANDEVKRFAYIVSHDLRAPLVNIKGFTGELRNAYHAIASRMSQILPHLDEDGQEEMSDILQEEIPEALQFIDSSASRMGNLIDAVLKLSRLGRRELRFERINVRVLVQKVFESLAHQVEQRQVAVRIGALPRVIADRTSLEQIFGNILVNAVNYLVPGRKGEIEIGGRRGRHETVFYVKDNGRGIAREDLPKVFEPFSRVGNSPEVPGEGMGLAYVQTLVRRHGGRIWCEAELGVGSTFYFSLPNHAVNGKESA